MKRKPYTMAEPEIQSSVSRSIQKNEHLKRAIRQHPQRDQPRIDSVDEGSPPSVEPGAGATGGTEVAAASLEERHGMIEEAAGAAREGEPEGSAEPENVQTGGDNRRGGAR